jgi:UDP-N-acetylmuramoyl-tripeptide--D-alanyl-D-alanine ligase
MEPRALQFIADACEGEMTGASAEKTAVRVCTDSRQLRAGDVFVALRGERFDGHNFVAEACRKAAAVMIERNRPNLAVLEGCAAIRVDDTRKALGRLAARYRQDFSLPVIAVAGSNGKTTTKELIASVLNRKLATLSSESSFNNDVGVPATLLRLESAHQAAVIEAGTNHPGELAPLVRMIRPAMGVITSIGREHLEFFEDLEGVAREEGCLAELLPGDGKLLVNGDEPWGDALIRRSRAGPVRVGFGDGNDWRAHSARLEKQGVKFRVEAPVAGYSGEYRVSLLGRHQALNSLFAIAVGAELGLTRQQIEQGLAECKPPPMRMQLWEVNGVRVLDDTYNANADSVAAALQTMKELPCQGRRVAVLGDMAELGKHSEAAHEEVGRRAAELGIGQLFAVGKMAAVVARGARAAGLTRVLEFQDLQTAGSAIKQFVKEGDLLLLKASRVARLERIAELLKAGEPSWKNPAGANGKPCS